MKPKIYRGMFLLLIVVCGGCGRLVDWGKSHFNQGIERDVALQGIQKYLQSVHIYTQMRTNAIFDALWLSDEVRSMYVDLYASRHGLTKEAMTSLYTHQLDFNTSTITFYVLSLHEVSLTDMYSNWSLLLRVDQKLYTPLSIKMIDLSPEWQVLFGKRYTRFKQAYEVIFDAFDQSMSIITHDTDTIELLFRSIAKEAILTWHSDIKIHGI